MNDKTQNIIFIISAVAVVAAAAVYPLHWVYTPYIFAVGAAGVAIARLSRHYKGDNLRLKRLYRMETLSGLLLVVASYFMFKERNEWLLILTISAILQLYAAFVIPKAEK